MKKVLAMILVLVMVLSLSTVALASNTIQGGTEGKTSEDVVVNVEGGSVATVYSIIIKWTNLIFTYQQGAANWDGEEGEYVYADGKWVDNKNTGSVTVTNKSNTDITVSAEVINEKGNFKATLENTSFTLTSYDQVSTAQSGTVNITVNLKDGVKQADLADDQDGAIGTVKLTIS